MKSLVWCAFLWRDIWENDTHSISSMHLYLWPNQTTILCLFQYWIELREINLILYINKESINKWNKIAIWWQMELRDFLQENCDLFLCNGPIFNFVMANNRGLHIFSNDRFFKNWKNENFKVWISLSNT